MADSKKYLNSPAIAQDPIRRIALAPIMHTTDAIYYGPSQKLVVALDIGTTFSGAAYGFLDPRKTPIIRSVTKQVFSPAHSLVMRGSE